MLTTSKICVVVAKCEWTLSGCFWLFASKFWEVAGIYECMSLFAQKCMQLVWWGHSNPTHNSVRNHVSGYFGLLPQHFRR